MAQPPWNIQLKGHRFSSFSELNAEISIITDELNNREFSKEKGNRKELFDKYDKPALKPLPHESLKPYTYVIKTVPNNYHVEYDNHYYSVPHTYYKQEVTLKATYFDIIICDYFESFDYQLPEIILLYLIR